MMNAISPASAWTPAPQGRAPQPAKSEGPDLSAPSAKAVALAEGAKKVSEAYLAGRQEARDIAKSYAKARVEQLREQLRIFGKLLSGDPKALAKQVARIAKELHETLKDFSEAHKSDLEDAALVQERAAAEPDADAPDTEAASVAKDTPGQAAPVAASGADNPADLSPTDEMKDFIKQVRGVLKKLKEALQEAKLKAGLEAFQPFKKDDPFKLANEAMSDLQGALDHAFYLAELETQAMDAPGARVSVTV